MVSIVIPLYNARKYIEKTLKSCLIQTYIDLEVIIVDDCSKDNSLAIVLELAKKDSRILIIQNEENLGVIKTINIGLRHCKGEYVIVLGNDDILDKRHIEIFLNYMMNSSYSFLYCSSLIIDENDNIIGKKKAENINNNAIFARYNPINACGIMINYQYLKSVDFYPEYLNFKNCGEWYLWIELLHLGNACYVKEIKSYYRIHTSNLTKKLYSKDNIRSTKEYSILCMKKALTLEGIDYKRKIIYTLYRFLYSIKMSIKIWLVLFNY